MTARVLVVWSARLMLGAAIVAVFAHTVGMTR